MLRRTVKQHLDDLAIGLKVGVGGCGWWLARGHGGEGGREEGMGVGKGRGVIRVTYMRDEDISRDVLRTLHIRHYEHDLARPAIKVFIP